MMIMMIMTTKIMIMMLLNRRTWQERLYARPTVKKFHSRTIEALTGGTEDQYCYLYLDIAIVFLLLLLCVLIIFECFKVFISKNMTIIVLFVVGRKSLNF